MTQKLVAKKALPVDDETLTTMARTMRDGETVWLLDRAGTPLGRVRIEWAKNGKARVAFTARRWIRLARLEGEKSDG